MEDAKIIALVGPTASGKTSLAIEIAKKYNGEVVSVDSRQVYKTLDIGTEKVSKEEMDGISHHMIDIVEPEEVLSVQQFQKLGREVISDIIKRGKLPILAGGSGQYMDALLYTQEFPQVEPNEKLREELETLPASALMKILEDQDKSRAETIDPNNKQRIIRALEIVDALGEVPKQNKLKPFYTNVLYLGIATSRENIKDRIFKRLTETLEKGLIDEIKEVKERVGTKRLNSFGLEYRVIGEYLEGNIKDEDLTEKLAHELNQYAKRQMTWFKKNKDIIWGEKEELFLKTETFLRS